MSRTVHNTQQAALAAAEDRSGQQIVAAAEQAEFQRAAHLAARRLHNARIAAGVASNDHQAWVSRLTKEQRDHILQRT